MTSPIPQETFQSILEQKISAFKNATDDGKSPSKQADATSDSTKSIELDLLEIAWLYRGLTQETKVQNTISRGKMGAYPSAPIEDIRRLERENWLARLSITQSAAAEFFFSRGENMFWMDATGGKLKKAYRTLAKKIHPDRFHASSETVKKSYAKEFNSLHEAYQILKESPLGMGSR